jgi:hypothetical protein
MKRDRSTRAGSKYTTPGRPFPITSDLASSVKLRAYRHATASHFPVPIQPKPNGIATSICNGVMTPRHYLALIEFFEDFPTGWESMPPHEDACTQKLLFWPNAPKLRLHREKIQRRRGTASTTNGVHMRPILNGDTVPTGTWC